MRVKRQQLFRKLRAPDDERVMHALLEFGGKPATARQVAGRCGVTMMAAVWSLNRLIGDGQVMRSMRSEPGTSRATELVPYFVAACCAGHHLADFPAWLIGVNAPQVYTRRLIAGRAGLSKP